ncbi:hypothetical protein CARUB_v10002726mg, partial [Capsella rubella]
EHIPIEDVFKHLECSREGLSEAEVEKRLEIFGPNKIEDNNESKVDRFFGLMTKPLSLVMESAAIMAIALAIGGGGSSGWLLFVGVVCFLLYNTIQFYLEEANVENLAASLMACLSPRAKVLRDGEWSEQEASVLVPGDVVRIKQGDIISCDARLLEGDGLKVVVTGESRPIKKGPGDVVHSGFTCKHGEMEAVVISTGVHTLYAGFFSDSTTNRVGHFHEVVAEVGKFCIISIAIGIVIELIVMCLIQERTYKDVLDNLLVLLIGGIPITLPSLLSKTMNNGFLRLCNQGTLAKRLTAIENMAGMDVLCSNKTGTLTLNKLSVDKNLIEVYAKDVDKDQVLLLAARASRTKDQDAFDTAMVEMLTDPKEARNGIIEVHFFPFDPVAKRTALTYIDCNGNWHRVSKGAPEQILDLCNASADLRKNVHSTIGKYAERGLSSLAVARQNVPEKTKESSGDPWELVGVLPLFDPPRHDSAEAIRKALDLGVKVKMFTGDQIAIAKETGRILGMGTNIYPSTSLLNNHLPVDKLIENADGFAGALREYKYEVVEWLKTMGHSCGIIGDGVNDIPAMKKANIGIAVAGASESVLAASDIVFTEPGLSVIIDAVLISRATLQIMKYHTVYAVSMTIRVVFGFMFIALVWNFDISPLMVLAILLLNDGPYNILTFSTEKVKMPSPTPDSRKLNQIFATGLVLGGYMALVTVLFFWGAYKTDFFPRMFHVSDLRGNEHEMMSALYLQVSIMSQALIFVLRSRSWSFVERPRPLLLCSFAATQCVATVVAVYPIWEIARMEGIGWGWACIIWLYDIIFFLTLDIVKFAIRYILTGKASQNVTGDK